MSLVDAVSLPAELLERLGVLGVRVEEVLRRADLTVPHGEPPRLRLTTREFFAFWSAVEREAQGRRDLGLVLGSQALEHGYSVASMAALLTSNLAEALCTMARYKRLVCPEHVEVEIARGEANVRFHWILAETQVPRLLGDSTFAAFIALARRGTGTSMTPRRIELARRRADARMLTEHFGCDIRFAAPFDRIVFDAQALAVPFVTHDAQALAKLVPGLEAALVGRSQPRSLCDDVCVAIVRHMCSGGRPTVANIARRLRVSSRTLQRRLEEERTSYQEQLAEVRQRTARRLLANTDLDTVEVAFLLGFEEPNSFARAFRSWEGMTPIRWRAGASRISTPARA